MARIAIQPHHLKWAEFLYSQQRTKPRNYNSITLADIEFLKGGGYWDTTDADKCIGFIEKFCVQSKDPFYGKLVELQPWQKKLIRNLFSWKKPDGTNRYSQLSLYCPKKQGKSALCSCLALFFLCSVPGSLGLILASDLTEADNVFGEASAMAQMHDSLNELLWVRPSARTIEYSETLSKLQVLSGMPTGKSGKNWNLCILDELSFWRSSTAQLVWDQLAGSNATKKNSLRVIITTAGFSKDGNIGYQHYQIAKSILAGDNLDTTILPAIFELNEQDDWQDERNWHKANPSLGHTVSLDYLKQEFDKCKDNPIKENEFRTLKLNQWTGRTGYISQYLWGQCAKKFNEKDFWGKEAYIGCDWGRAYDLAATCVIVRDGDKFIVMPRLFTPNDLAFKKQCSDGVPFLAWGKQNYIYLTEGDVIDERFIRQTLADDFKNFKVLGFLYDPKGMEETRKILAEDYPDLEEKIQPIEPGFGGMSEPTAIFEKFVKTGKIIQPNNPVLNWCLNNVVLRSDAFNRLIPAKAKSRGRIDGVSATLIALAGWCKHVDEIEIDYTPFSL